VYSPSDIPERLIAEVPMRLLTDSAIMLVISISIVSAAAMAQSARTGAGIRLEDVPWTDAEAALTPDTIVVLPLGAAAKEHGPHLKLRADLTLAEHLTRRVMAAATVTIAPTLTYHHYPAFLEYPGSTSLAFNTARDLTADVVRSLAQHGPRRFYVLNTGISTVRPLDAAAKILAADGMLLHYTHLEKGIDGAVRSVQQQHGGTHADEIETSMMLYVDPSAVDMTKAVKDYAPRSVPFRLTRRQGGQGTYSPSGVWGDATLATREKGRVIVDALVESILADIEALRRAPLPSATPLPAESPTVAPRPPGEHPPAPRRADRCTEGDERAIRGFEGAFTVAWTNQDAVRIASLWTTDGDMVHPDGLTERSPQVIRQNRAYLFARPEYRRSRHPLTLGNVRCIADTVAIVDGKWELRDVVDAKSQPVPTITGLLTLVMKKGPGGWSIDAWRYTINQPPAGTVPPTLLKRPGFPDIR
jgi:creatinine amidohydrolase